MGLLSIDKYPVLPPDPTLPQMQHYIQQVVRYRSFEGDDALDTFAAFCEEVGRLAKAVRIYNDVKVKMGSKIVDLQYEIADVFWALACVSNQLEVDIESAIRIREEQNKQRVWVDGIPLT